MDNTLERYVLDFKDGSVEIGIAEVVVQGYPLSKYVFENVSRVGHATLYKKHYPVIPVEECYQILKKQYDMEFDKQNKR